VDWFFTSISAGQKLSLNIYQSLQVNTQQFIFSWFLLKLYIW